MVKADGIRAALIKNGTSKEQREKLERFGLGKYFEIILIEQEIGCGKPERRVYELALEMLALTADQVLGIYSLWCDYAKEGLPKGSKNVPDGIITDISELLTLLNI